MIAVISPHLDDGVLGCGDLLAANPGSTVITVFAGGQADPAAVTTWDQLSGFRPGDDVIAVRRAEDRAALAVLGALPVWLDHPDSQYAPPSEPAAIEHSLENTLARLQPAKVFFPLGLFHADHELVHAAALALCRRLPYEWYLYEDAIYRHHPGHPPKAKLERIRKAGFRVAAADLKIKPDLVRKKKAVDCYASQLLSLGKTAGTGFADVFAAGRYWKVSALDR